jgi:8-oxo-dGTP pyrophosphatase MutT (NUDIX family)
MAKLHISSGGIVFRPMGSAGGQGSVPREKSLSSGSGRAGEIPEPGRAGVGEEGSVLAEPGRAGLKAGCYEVALIRVLRARGGTAWALPKGWVEQGEEPEQTAVREVREETGLQTRVLRKVDEISYQFYSRADHDRISKTVHLFLLECLGGDTADHDTEVEEARWFPIEEAGQRLTYKNEREALEKAAVLLEEGEHTT